MILRSKRAPADKVIYKKEKLMNWKNLIMLFLIPTFSTQSTAKDDTYIDVQALLIGISQDYVGMVMRAQHVVNQMGTNPAQAANLKDNALRLALFAKEAFEKIKRTFNNPKIKFSEVQDKIPSFKDYKTSKEWIDAQTERLAQLEKNINNAVPVRDRSASEPMLSDTSLFQGRQRGRTVTEAPTAKK